MDASLQAIVEAVMSRENPEGVFILYIPTKEDLADSEDPEKYMEQDPYVTAGLSPSSSSSTNAIQTEANSPSAPISGLGNAP